MDGQLPVALLVILAATAYLVRQTWRAWAGQGQGCGGRCRCGDTAESPRATLIRVEQLTLRSRQGG